MANNQVAAQLEYAKLQMAAEALFDIEHNAPAGGTVGARAIDPNWLVKGNDHSSRFTQTQADDFIKKWQLVEHQANTATGFSGTLFKYVGDDNPDLGLVKNQLVISFRSTVFIEDAARDNQATNELEIKEFGWAFGQIDDMKKWVHADAVAVCAGTPANEAMLVDSLSVQNTLAQLDPSVSANSPSSVLQAASKLKEGSVGGNEGNGTCLETVRVSNDSDSQGFLGALVRIKEAECDCAVKHEGLTGA